MSNGWELTTIGELCSGIYDGPHATPKKTDSGPIFLGIWNLSGGRLDLSTVEHLSESDFVRWTRRVTPGPGDVVFSYETRLGEAALIPKGLRCCLGRRMGLLRPNRSRTDPRFLLYAYLGPGFQATIRGRTIHGSTVDRIPLTELPDFPIRVPPLHVQRRIADILGSLDDKIELNRRMNQTLEAMAQALYKHWFVDFGPFRDGEFVDSELGPIPKGWRAGYLGEVANNVRKAADPRRLPPATPYIGLEHMPKGSIALGEWGRADQVTSNKAVFLRGQILFGKLRPYFKKIGVAPVDGVASSDILVIEPSKPQYFGLVLSVLIQDSFVDKVSAGAGGTRMPRTNWEQMAKYPIPIPPNDVLAAFNSYIQPWMELIVRNVVESRTLMETRDYLLPKLLSGEVEVKVAEKEVEGVL